MRRDALAIANAKGLPGTAGIMVASASGAPCLLTTHHVAFGEGAGIGDRVWALASDDDHQPGATICVGRTAAGRIGRIAFNGEISFVDCALVQIEHEERFPAWLTAALARLRRTDTIEAVPGLAVVKNGATTGRTEGRIVDVAYADHPYVGDRWWSAPGQLLVDASDRELNFSAGGDSGAGLLDGRGSVVGLLWGSNANGQGIACPIAPVLECLAAALMTRQEHMPRFA